MYRGRFAPTPSGPLHFGSLVAALASYLDARSHQGEWLVRIEDVDPPRAVAGSAAAILHALERHGFEWDGEVLYQGGRLEVYLEALGRLMDAGRVYSCTCTRKQIAESGVMGVDGPVYPRSCRGRSHVEVGALRFALDPQRVVFQDALLGWVACDVDAECGDFVLRRADGVFSYQLAVVVDDAAQGISHVVRGADLLASTPRQIVLQQALGYATPLYMHVPVVLDGQGCKLSKQTLAAPLDDQAPLSALRQAGRFLGLPEIGRAVSARAWMAEAVGLWDAAVLPVLRGRQPG